MDIKVVAELCCNHLGDLSVAKKMIETAAASGASYAKFQKWDAKTALSPEQYQAPHPNSHHSFGHPYGKHRENLEFTVEEHAELKAFCDQCGIVYATSVFDRISAEAIGGLNPEYIKIPSQKNLKVDMYDIICHEFDGDIHISSGMTTAARTVSCSATTFAGADPESHTLNIL